MESTTTRYDNVIMAFATIPLAKLAPGESNSRTLIVPNVARLTDARRLVIGRAMVAIAGLPLPDWDAAPESARLSWTRTHMGRYDHCDVIDYADGTRSYVTPTSGGSNYPAAHMIVMTIEELTALDNTKEV